MKEPRKRIKPRRPYILTQAGLRRVTLGAAGEAPPSAAPAAVHHAAVKPTRLGRAASAYLLVAVHTEDGLLDEQAHQAIVAAALLAGADSAVVVLVLGELTEALDIYGADLIAVLPPTRPGAWEPERELAMLRALITDYAPRHIFMPDNESGDGDLGRRLAAELGSGIATSVVELTPGAVACYADGGALLARGALPFITLLAPGTVDTALPFIGTAAPVALPPVPPFVSLYQAGGIQTIATAALALEEADFIFAAGDGVADIATFTAVAQHFGAAIGASRVAVDAGRFRRDQQIGATGKTVQARVYVAVGISGAVQHLQGIKACRHVISINHDGSAPMVKRADLNITGDAQEVMTALLAKLRQRNVPEPVR